MFQHKFEYIICHINLSKHTNIWIKEDPTSKKKRFKTEEVFVIPLIMISLLT